MRIRDTSRMKASSLFITVVLALIFGVLCSLLIVLAYNNHQVRRNAETDARLQRNLQSAINLVLADTSVIIDDQNDPSDLFGRGGDSATIKKENWGLYSVACVEVRGGKKAVGKNFFLGQSSDPYLDACLYLAEQDAPLSLVGGARLVGDGWLPKAGLRPAYFNQRGYDLNILIEGAVRVSRDSMPGIDQRLIARLSSLMMNKGYGIQGQDTPTDTLEQSFADTPYIAYRGGPIMLTSGSLKGHILIVSDSMIRVGSGVSLQDVILAAPVIEFEAGFTGRLQAIASDSIVVGNNCRFMYPSSLVLCKMQTSPGQPALVIGDSCQLAGAVVSTAQKKDLNKTYVELGKHTTVEGLVYVAGYLNLKGHVQGTVMTDNFIYKSPPNVLLNYLVDAEIDRSALSKYFIGPHLFISPRQNHIVQWVN
jgi:hypothetical protein